MMLSTGKVNRGYADLLHLALMRRLVRFEWVWMLEYDVDFSRHWGVFFSEFQKSDADLLGTTLYCRDDSSVWGHWPKFCGPGDLPDHNQARGFFPVLRMSQRFAKVYVAERDVGWSVGLLYLLFLGAYASNALNLRRCHDHDSKCGEFGSI
jgi:hypothetical protein